jgi:GMP synthase-like glutamine amidotransferase
MRKILVVDGGMKQGLLRLQSNDYFDKNLKKVAAGKEVLLDRLVLHEHAGMDSRRVKQLLKDSGPHCGVIINGAGLIHPTDDRYPLSSDITSGRLNKTVLNIIEHVLKEGIPLLGICYGHQMIGRLVGEEIKELPRYEFGFVEVELTDKGGEHPMFKGLPKQLTVAEYHGFGIVSTRHTEALAYNDLCIQAISLPGTKAVGVQFHMDFYEDVDGNGTGALEYYHKTDATFLKRVTGDGESKVRPKDSRTYAMNNEPLLRFLDSCDHRD